MNMGENWFKKSENFQKTAQNCFKNQLYDVTCFAVQQTVELYMKGLIIERIGHKPFTHKLEELIDELKLLKIEIPENIIEDIISIEEFYIQSRYPDSRMRDFSKHEAESALEKMERIIHFFRSLR